MNAKLFSAIAVAATAFFLPQAGRANTIIYNDNASNYPGGYAGQGGTTPGFGAFTAIGTGSAGTFVASASESEGNNGTPSPGSIDSSGVSFGLYAQGGSSTETVTRSFNVPTQSSGLVITGDAFSLDFVTGYNDGGSAGVTLTSSGGNIGSFTYNGSDGHYYFNGNQTTQTYNSGALHLTYTLLSPTTYSFSSTGAVTYSNTGTFASPATGFQVQQTNSGSTSPDHNAYFNNLSLTAAPEPSQVATVSFMALGLGGLLLRRRQMSAVK